MTQNERILDYISLFGSISTMEAFLDLGITSLPKRISEMSQQGLEFNKEWEQGKNRFGEKVTYKRYSLKG